MFVAFLLIFLGGFSHATFGLGQKRFEPLSWEAFWLPFAFLSMVVAPVIYSFFLGSDFWNTFNSLSLSTFLTTASFGACWGLAAIFWGKSLIYLGMSLTYGLILSITMVTGSLIPMLKIDGILSSPAFPFIIIGTLVMLIGVALVTYAGIVRDKQQLQSENVVKGIQSGKLFKIGLLLALFSGILGALQNIGFSVSLNELTRTGVPDSKANLVSWMVVFIGGFLMQGGYSIYLLIKNKSYTTYTARPRWKYILKICVTAIFWLAALLLYGDGASKIGKLGTSIGWTMFLSLSLVLSNTYAYILGEWDRKSSSFKYLVIGNLILISSWIVLGYSNSLINF